MADVPKMKQAMVERERFRVLPFGIPEDARLQECDGCHEVFPLREVEIVGTQVLCGKCRRES